MNYIVSITSQGQISIPSNLRRELKLTKRGKVLVKHVGEKIIIEPIPDLLSLKGSLKDKATKGKDINQIITLENQAVTKTLVDHYKDKLQRSN